MYACMNTSVCVRVNYHARARVHACIRRMCTDRKALQNNIAQAAEVLEAKLVDGLPVQSRFFPVVLVSKQGLPTAPKIQLAGVEIHVHIRVGEALGNVHCFLHGEVGLDDHLQFLHPFGLQIVAIFSCLDLDQGVLGALCAILAADDRVDVDLHWLGLLPAFAFTFCCGGFAGIEGSRSLGTR